jgi:peptidyl-prolyl cis-trans isomerase D
MLTAIRDKLKTWAVILLVILVAIPLVFLGVGDYGTNTEQYAFKVDDQEISKSIVLQEMGQFKDVLRKNYEGSIPPIYTNEFIKNITIDNLIRRTIENNISTNMGLALSDDSIIDDIQNTSSFRNEEGFDSKIYKRRLFTINMSPDTYEQYVYQKGIRDQLRKAITGSSIVGIYDKKINVNANYHIKKGKLLLLKQDEFQDEINISLDDINAYYENNKESFYSNEEAEFEYIRLKKADFIKSIKITEEELIKEYNIKLKSGTYKQDDLYEINHLVFPVKDDKTIIISEAKKALSELENNVSFSKISEIYNVDDDTKANNGYLGKVTLGDMPNVIKSNILDMNLSDIKMITSESNAIHILRLIQKEKQDDKRFSEVREEIHAKLSNEKGSSEYFLTLDSIKNKIYSDKVPLVDISEKFNLPLSQTPKISTSYNSNIFSSKVLQQLFSNINEADLYSPIYISNDDVLFIRKVKYYQPKQLSLKDTEGAIRALLTTQTINDLMSTKTNIALKNLNNGSLQSFEQFKLYKYDDKFDDEIMKIINNQSVTENFVSYKLSSGNYLLLKLDSFEEIIDREKVESDNYFDYLENTQSEGDYNNFYISKYKDFVIDINDDYLNQ